MFSLVLLRPVKLPSCGGGVGLVRHPNNRLLTLLGATGYSTVKLLVLVGLSRLWGVGL